MPLDIHDEEVIRLAEELAARDGVSTTEAVRKALVKAIHADKRPLLERLKPLQQELAKYPRTGLKADKAFFDSLNDE